MLPSIFFMATFIVQLKVWQTHLVAARTILTIRSPESAHNIFFVHVFWKQKPHQLRGTLFGRLINLRKLISCLSLQDSLSSFTPSPIPPHLKQNPHSATKTFIILVLFGLLL